MRHLAREGEGVYAGIYEATNHDNASLNINTNGIILEALWFIARGRQPFLQKQETAGQ